MAGGFCGILALVGIAGITAQSLGFVYQRQREFARLRSVGMTPAGIFKMLGIEGMLTAVRPLVLALPLLAGGAAALVLLSRQTPGGFLATFPHGLLLAYVGTVLLVVVAVSVFGALRLVRQDLAEALRNDALA